MGKRVCLVTPRFPPDVGGVAQASYRRAQHLKSSGSLACVLKPTELPPTLKAAQALFQESPWDLIHGYYPSQVGPQIQQLSAWVKTPYLLSARGNDIDKDIWNAAKRPALLDSLQNAHALTGVSRDLTRKLSALVSHTRCYYAPNSVDTTRFGSFANAQKQALHQRYNLPLDAFVLGFVGEMRTKKGFSLLLKAFARLHHSTWNRPPYLVIAGDVRTGADQELLHIWQQQQPQAAACVKRLPYIPHEDLPHIYGLLDLLVMPSFQEGMANAALEAMASGVPVLATDVGGFPDLLPLQNCIVPYSEPALYEALARLLQDPDLLLLRGAEGLKRVQAMFEHAHEQSRYDEIYAGVLATKV